ncbi:unnamed protein product [Camellia sinensis]
MFYQLLILPRFYPPSHYDVLGIKRYSSMEQVTEAYEKFSSKCGIKQVELQDLDLLIYWPRGLSYVGGMPLLNSGTEVPPIIEFIKV